MYCPKCNQAQASDEMRYCSRCGFPLGTVAILLQNDGVLPPLPNNLIRHSTRGRIATESVILTVVSWTIGLLATFLFDFGGPYELLAKVGAFIFFLVGFIGLLRFLYAFLFLRTEEADREHNVRQVSERNQPALPPAEQTPISDFPTKANTKEMVRPISVTENTTQLLDEFDPH